MATKLNADFKMEQVTSKLWRAKVPGGWFVLYDGPGGGMIFYPDPNHIWTGSSLP